MPTEPIENSVAFKPRRRWFQFSLRTLLIVSVLFSFAAAWYGSNSIRLKKQRAVVAKLKSLGCDFYYDIQHVENGKVEPGSKDKSFSIKEFIFGPDANSSVINVGRFGFMSATSNDIHLLGEIPTLKSVEFCEGGERPSGFNDESFKQLVQYAPQLKTLILRSIKLTPDAIKYLQRLQQLEEINLFFSPLDDNTFAELSKIPRLRILRISSCPFTSSGIANLASSKLEHLEISGPFSYRVEGQQSEQADISVFLNLPRETPAYSNSFGAEFAAICRIKSLKSLHLVTCNWVSDADIPKLKNLDQLQMLLISHCPVTGRTFDQIGSLDHLTYLNFSDQKLNDEGVKKFLQACPNIRSLHIGWTSITDASIEELLKLKKLEGLRINSTLITNDACKRLIEFPNLKHIYLDERQHKASTYIIQKRPDIKFDWEDPVFH